MSDSSHAPTVRSLDGAGLSHDHDHGHASHDDHGHDDHGGLAKYIYVFIALCVLTGMSFLTYSDYWPWRGTPKIGHAFMIAVSCTKAMLVILFFMHVKYEANWKYVLTIPAGLMSIFLVLMLVPDIYYRNEHAAQERELFMASPYDLDPATHPNLDRTWSSTGPNTSPKPSH
ncbi:MAG: cytochrome C oxidase subunit IV family protein [Pirellulales bacterium]